MGKVKSFIQFNGTIDGMNFYVVNGQQYVRKAGGGFNGKKIKSDPSMIKVRQNGEEFGRVSKLSRAFRLMVEPLFPTSYSGGLHNRLVKLFSGIKNLDVTSERGKRCVSVGIQQEASHPLLIGFSIPHDGPKGVTLHEHVSMDWSSSILTFGSNFQVANYFPTTVKAISFTIGVIRLNAEALTFEMILGEKEMVLEKELFPTTLSVPEPAEKSSGDLVFVVLQQYEEYQGVLQPLQLKQSVYFEVVAVR
ncbi:hypothetical protein [Flavobacterium sp.]|uniref:hypothetical protein n=1 Tax=Flavobacterium sp. TaxID=239 RepID=UPI0035278DB2